VTKKLGGAALRNRVRRRLKEALRLAPDLLACRGYDYVILARQAVLNRDFTTLQEDLARAIAEVHTRPKAARPRPPRTAKSRRPSLAASANTKD
jgi:ribonuclease P protein component